MYLHLGRAFLVHANDILGIFDLDTTSFSHISRQFLSQAEKLGQVVNLAGEELPKSFVLCHSPKGKTTVYLSQLNSTTLLKRAVHEGFLESI